MKRIQLFLAALLVTFAVSAEDILQVVPFQAQPGLTENDWEEYFSLNLTNTHPYTSLQFDIILPEGMLLLEDEPYEGTERMPGYTRKGQYFIYHDVDITNKGNGHYRFLIDESDLKTVNGSEGEIFKLYYTTSADMKEGVYPITLSNVVLVYETEEIDEHGLKVLGVTKIATSTSYVQIGDAKGAVQLTGEIPSFVSETLANGAVSSVDLSAATHVYGTLPMVDGISYTFGEGTEVDEVTYGRTFEKNFGTVCLPFATQSDETVQYYQLLEVTDEYMTFEPVDDLPANTPAIFKVMNNTLSASAQNVVLAKADVESTGLTETADWSMKGTFAEVQLDPATQESAIYYISNDKFVYANMAFTAAPFRAWFETPSENAAKSFSLLINEEEAVGINCIEHEDGKVSVVYDIAGRMLGSEKRNTINIKNKKKYFVR